MKRGFTLVELMIVIAVIGVLASIITVGYIKYQEQADSAYAKSIATLVVASSESYKNKNFEYPAASSLSTQSTTGNPPTDNYAKVALLLGLQASGLANSTYSFVPCSGPTNCVFKPENKSKIFYITKSTPKGVEDRYVLIDIWGNQACSYWFKADTEPNQDYIIAYFNLKENAWILGRSSSNVLNSAYCGMNGV